MESTPVFFITALGVLASLMLVALNGFFVAAEFAIVKVRRTRLEELSGKGVKAARISILCVDELDEYLSATQLGITVVSLALGWIGESTFADLLWLLFPGIFSPEQVTLHIVATVLAFMTITMLHVVFGELVPKNMAIQNAEKITLKIAKPLHLFYRASRILIHAFTVMANSALRVLGYNHGEEPPLSEQELKLVMKESREEGVISESEAQIINRAFEFSDKRARDLLVPEEQVAFISLSRPYEENLAIMKRNMYSRYPISQDGFDTITGVVHVKDAWPLLMENPSNETIEKCKRPVVFVDPGMRQDRLFRDFQRRRAHLGVVRDPRSHQNLGIVTVEDILEELVGEIRDEHDVA